MNAHRPPSRQIGGVLLALGLIAWPAAMSGQPGDDSILATLRRADALYHAGRILEAEPQYRRALRTRDNADRRHCYDRLLAIYAQVGRQDQAIRTGLEYLRWLRELNDQGRARLLELDLGRWYLGLGHHAAAEPHLREAIRDVKDSPVPAALRISALTCLAIAAEKQGLREQTARAWREVETFALARLNAPARELPLALRIECVRGLADCYRFQGRPAEAIPQLEQVLPLFDRLSKPDWAGQRDTLRQLVGHLLAVKRPADAEKRLREALDLHQRHAHTDGDDPLLGAELSCELADVLERLGRTPEAVSLREQAARQYR